MSEWPPSMPGELGDFPSISTRPRLWRIHRTQNEPAFFSTSGLHRFDPPAGVREEFGTCYLAPEPTGAFLETLGRSRVVALESVEERSLTEMRPRDKVRLADITSRRVRGFGITVDLSTGVDYSVSQEWAAALQRDGFDGIRYRRRHDPRFEYEAVALFSSPGGVQKAAFELVKNSRPIPDSLLSEIQQEFGIVVVPSIPLT